MLFTIKAGEALGDAGVKKLHCKCEGEVSIPNRLECGSKIEDTLTMVSTTQHKNTIIVFQSVDFI